MDSRNRSPDDRAPVPEADPAASSMPRIPIPPAANVPAVMRERHDSADRLRVSCCYSTGRTQTGLLRGLDGDERRIVISCPWGQDPARTVAAIWNDLTADEQAEVAEAFGLNP